MHSSDIFISRASYGLAFAIEDLVLLRNWADQRRLKLTIALDCSRDGVEFEELFILTAFGAKSRTLTVWRTAEGVFAQAHAGHPRSFASMIELLSQVRPAAAGRTPWRQRLGLT